MRPARVKQLRPTHSGPQHIASLGGADHCRGLGRQFLEIEIVQPPRALASLFGADADLVQIARGQSEMPVKVRYAVAKPFDILVKFGKLLADRPGLLPHSCVFQHGPHGVEYGHAGGGRYDPDLGGKSFAHQIGEVGVQLGIDGL
jgi:hypothetical protein